MTHAGGWLALAALAFVPFTFDHFEVPQQLVLALGVVVLSYTRKSLEVSRSHALAIALVVGAALVTTFTSSAPALSWTAILPLLIVSALSFSTAGFRLLFYAAWPIAAWALLQATGLDPFQWAQSASWCGGIRPFSTLGHPTQLGVFMALLCVLALEERRWATAAVTAITCVLTLSRAGWLTLAVGVAAWLVLSRGVRPLRSRRTTWLAVPVTLIVAMGVVGPAALWERLTHFFVAPTRLALWRTALAGFQLHPFTGWGFDTFVLVDQQLRQPEAWQYEWGTTATHAHSIVPNTLATQGVVGIAALLLAVFITARSWRRDGIAHSGAAAATIAWASASLVCFSNVLLAALGACVFAASFKKTKTVALPGWLPLLTLLPCALGLAQFGASVAGAKAITSADARWFDVANGLEPTSSLWPALLGEVHETKGQLELANTAYAEALRITPGTAIFEANVARVASKRGDREAALNGFERARRLAPLDAHIAVDAAEASMRLKEWELAAATLANTLAHYPHNGLAWWALARTRYAQGRTLEARAALEAAVEADWREWPEGVGLARDALVELASSAGDLARAEKYASRPERFAAPADICGAPARLR